MTSIGGYFASLDLVTNASSFERARKYFASISSDAHIASEAVERLQEQIASNAASFFKGGNASTGQKRTNSYEQFNGYKMNPQSGYIVDETEKEQQKRAQRNDYLTRLASMYVLLKLLGMLKDLAVKLATLTYAITQANMKAYTNAVQANMSPNALKMWSMAANINRQDADDMLSRFTAFNKAFVDLGLGQGDAFGAIAGDMSLLSRVSGVDLDPKKMIGLDNDQRIAAVFGALKEAFGKNEQLAIQLSNRLLGQSATGILTGDMSSGKNSLAMAQGALLAPISAKDVAVGQEFGLMKAGLDEMKTLLGQVVGRKFYDEVMRFNRWLSENKGSIQAVFDNFAAALQLTFDAIEGTVGIVKKVDAWFQKLNAELNKWVPIFGAVPGDPTNGSAWKSLTPEAFRAQADAALAAEGHTTVVNITVQGNMDQKAADSLQRMFERSMQGAADKMGAK